MEKFRIFKYIFHIIGLLLFIVCPVILLIGIGYYYSTIIGEINMNINDLQIIIFVAVILLISGIIMMILPDVISMKNSKKIERQTVWEGLDFKHVLLGMIKVQGNLNLQEIFFKFGIKFGKLQKKISNLIKMGKLNGQIKGSFFKPIGDGVDTVEILLNELKY